MRNLATAELRGPHTNEQTHALCEVELPVWWKDGSKSRGLWSLRPSGDLVVFVHGFTGHAVTTWSRFNVLLRGCPEAAGSDLVFFGYDGLRTRATVSAGHLLKFMRQLHNEPSKIINPSLQSKRSPDFRFRRTILVAHSLGAVVSRMALLEATHRSDEWARDARLLLFAPAHTGAQALRTASALFGALQLSAAVAIGMQRAAVLHDLEADSKTLQDLRDGTRSAIEQGHRHLAASAILHCERDGVVHPNAFCDQDAEADTVDRSHMNICKPDEHYEEPMRVLRRLLANGSRT